MSYINRIQKAIEYIEAHLQDEIDLEKVANTAGFSMYHFHRIFHGILGETMKEYIRKRRLTNAANQLLTTDCRIIDIAYDYQFGSQEAFTRAFKRKFGITPGEYRRLNKGLILLDKSKLTMEDILHINGGISMEPKIITKQEFIIVGLSTKSTIKKNVISKLWDNFLPRMKEIKTNICASYGICEYVPNQTEDSEFTYIAGVEVENIQSIPKEMEAKTVPTMTYAVFTHKGPISMLGTTYDYIYGTWFPSSEYEPAEADDMEVYDERFKGPMNPDSEMEICIPVKKIDKAN